MSNVYVHFSLISFPARYSVVNLRLESHSLRFREVILAVLGTAVESLVQYIVPLSFLLDFGKHGTPTIGALDNPSEDVVISA